MAQKLKTIGAVIVAAAGTRVQLSSEKRPVSSISIQAPSTNTGNIFVGDSTVDAANGQVLIPGQLMSITPPNRSAKGDEVMLDQVYVDAASNGDQVRVSVLTQYRFQES